MNFGNGGHFYKPEGLIIEQFRLSGKKPYKNMVKPLATGKFIPDNEAGGCHSFRGTVDY